MTDPFVHRLRVRYVECDMQGVVFNAHYVTWIDIAHTEFWRATVGPWSAFVAEGLDVMVAEVGARFRGSATFDDDVDIAVTVESPTTTSMTSVHTMRRGGELLVEGRVRHVCVDATTHEKRPWPDHVRAAVAPHVVPADT